MKMRWAFIKAAFRVFRKAHEHSITREDAVSFIRKRDADELEILAATALWVLYKELRKEWLEVKAYIKLLTKP